MAYIAFLYGHGGRSEAKKICTQAKQTPAATPTRGGESMLPALVYYTSIVPYRPKVSTGGIFTYPT